MATDITCVEIPQIAEELKMRFENCTVLKAQDLDLLVELVEAIGSCVGGGAYNQNNKVINIDFPTTSDIGTETVADKFNALSLFTVFEDEIYIVTNSETDTAGERPEAYTAKYIFNPGKGVYGSGSITTLDMTDFTLIETTSSEQLISSITTGLETLLQDVSEDLPIYKGYNNFSNKHEIRGIKNNGDVSSVALASISVEGDDIDIAKLKSDTLILEKDVDGNVNINLPEVTEGLRAFYVNNIYTGEDEVGTIAKPYKTIDNALVDYIGTGTIDAPEFENSKVIVQSSVSNYFLNTPLNIKNLDITLEEDVDVFYSGSQEYMIDTRLMIGNYNSIIKIRGNGSFIINSAKGFIYNLYGDGITTGAKAVWFYDNLKFTNSYVPVGSTITDVPQTIGDTDYFLHSSGQPAIFFTGDSMEIPLFVFDERTSQGINCRIFGDLEISTATQTPFLIKNNALVLTFGSESRGITFSNSGSNINIIGGITDDGTNNSTTASTSFKYVEIQESGNIGLEKLNMSITGNVSNIKDLINLNSNTLSGIRLTINSGDWGSITEAETSVNIEDGSQASIEVLNVISEKNELFSVRQEGASTNIKTTINNCDLGSIISSNIDLTKNNTISVENRIDDKIKRSLVKYGTRVLAEAAGLELGDLFINTNSDDVDETTHFLDIII